MMKLKLIRFLLGIFISLLLFGCVDLDLAPTDKFSDETYWTSEEKASSLLNMAYRQMNSSGNAFRDERLSDNLYNGYGGDDIKNIVNGQANASTGIFNSTWGDLYGGIKTVHTFLANVDRVEMDEDVKERMKCEARFVRAYLYFQLTNWWGDVPFFTQDINIDEAKIIERTSQSVILEWLHSELEDIANGLPTKEEYSIDDRGRVTSGAAVALNARIALNYNDWDKVKLYTEMLIGKTEYGSYALHPNYEQIFYKEFEYNDEIILDVQYVPELKTWSEISVYVPFSLDLVQYILACPTQSLVDSYVMLDGSKWTESDDAYLGRDPRMDMTIVHNGSTISQKDGTSYTINVDPNDVGNTTNDIIGRENGSQTGYFYRKYYDPSPDAWTIGTSWSCNTNFVTLRYADILLMYAEAMNELGEMSSTIWDKTIKPIRQRAGFDDSSAALDYPTGDLQQVIRNERRVELALEGSRIYDIRRWETAEIVLNEPIRGAKFKLSGGNVEYFTYSENSFNSNRDYLWAVPRQELTINPNLGQNEGYN